MTKLIKPSRLIKMLFTQNLWSVLIRTAKKMLIKIIPLNR